ncbi:unnamed protein product [Microthlaspi erraticum]|uniref:Integrase catalytic domain-containing protein n=1 Tax=Microthlaspi erraticum TaxID=1685480 RepID=A0A6D2JXG8_9BRAS|nr:unnamed protein product [Microthlaspi erraticum]
MIRFPENNYFFEVSILFNHFLSYVYYYSDSSISDPAYTLYPSNNPGTLITPVLLRGDNYSEWATKLWNSLQAKQKIGFIDGTIVKPETNPDLARWTATNSMIVGWIRTSIDPTIRSTVSHVPDAHKLWNALQRRFSVNNSVHRHLLTDDITNCRQNGQPVLEYYGRLSKLWEELQNFQTSRSCSCDASVDLEREREEARVHKFLFGLDEARFSSIRSQIIDEDPLPDLNSVYSRIVREEQHLLTMRSKDIKNEAVGFSVKSESPHSSTPSAAAAFRSRDPARSCTHCNRKGHDVSECFALHGYPEWFLEQQAAQGRGAPSQRGRGGRTTTSAGRGRGRANTTRTAPLHGTDTSITNVAPSHASDQIAALISLLQNQQTQLSIDRLSGKTKLTDVIIDTGASHHMTGDLSLLRDVRDIVPSAVLFPDGNTSRAIKLGTLSLNDDYFLRDVLYIPDFNCTLISVSKLLKQTGCIAIFTDTLCVVHDRFSRTLIGAGEEREGVYYFTGVTVARSHHATKDKTSPSVLWHRRLGHPSYKVLSALPVFNSFKFDFSHVNSCDICFRAKQTRGVFQDSLNNTSAPFDLIHCDVWGPYCTLSSCGAAYFLTIVDDYSRSVWTFLMLEKSETKGLIQNFCAMSSRQFGKPVKRVRSDNGTKFMVLSTFFREQGIDHQTSCVDTPQQNGRVERKHRHILNVARACLFQARLPVTFWGESILTAAHIINRTPSSVLDGKTPYELLHGTPPKYDLLRVFGCLSYAHRRGRDKDKFGDRSRKCLFVGYPFGKKGWRLYDLERNEFFTSRDVIFLEDEFPGIPDTEYVSHPVYQPDVGVDDWLLPSLSTPSTMVNSAPPAIPSAEATPIIPTTTDTTVTADSLIPASVTSSPNSPVTPIEAESNATPEPSSPGLHQLLGRGHRQRQPSVILKNFVTNTATLRDTPSLASSTSSLGSPDSIPGTPLYPISSVLSDASFSPSHKAFIAAITAAVEPTTYNEAIRDKIWRESMKEEVCALEINKTWIVVALPPGKKAIGSKWVFKIKHHSDGMIARHKSRLVALGNRQKEGLDYTDTFAPVAKPSTVRILLNIAAAKNWEVHQMDVHNAFLHGDLEEEVYMKLPPGFEGSDPSKVCLLKKSIYGLKQAPRCWFAKLNSALKTYGFKQSKADYSHFCFIRDNIALHILVYVDDFIVAGNDLSTIYKFKAYLSEYFHMKDLGKLKYFLGIEVARNADGFFLSQRKYALDILAESGLLASKPALTPMELNHKLSLATGEPLADPQRYRRLVGRLIYLTFTRPELCYSVHILSQFMQTPLQAHWSAAIRVVRYLKGCPAQGVLLRSDSDLRVTAYCDSDWNACPLTRKSLRAYIVLLGASPVSWKTKKQKTVSMSSAEAEYRSMSFALRELKWIKRLLTAFDVSHSMPMKLFCDSQSAIYIAANPVFHERTKHIENDCHLVRDAVEEKLITTEHITTDEQPADLLTKSLPAPTFTYLLSKLGIQDVSPPT